MDERNKAEYKLSDSSLIIKGKIPLVLAHFMGARRSVKPRIRQTFTTFEPNTFPKATPIYSTPRKTEVATTQSSGRDVKSPTKIKPITVFPKPVISATLTELTITR